VADSRKGWMSLSPSPMPFVLAVVAELVEPLVVRLRRDKAWKFQNVPVVPEYAPNFLNIFPTQLMVFTALISAEFSGFCE
jgi:hypothetical protein